MYPHRDRESIKAHYWHSQRQKPTMVGVMLRPFCPEYVSLEFSNVSNARSLFDFFIKTRQISVDRHVKAKKRAVRSSHKWNTNRSCGCWLAKGSFVSKEREHHIKHISPQGLFSALSPVVWGKIVGWVSEGVICDFGGGHLEDDQVITCDQARHPQVTNHWGVSRRKAGENESVEKHLWILMDGVSFIISTPLFCLMSENKFYLWEAKFVLLFYIF